MSEADTNREPIELVQIKTPKCANVFGSGRCRAGMGTLATTALSADFARDDYLDTLYTAIPNGTGERVVGAVRLTASGAMQFRSVTAGVGDRFAGDDFRYVVVDLTARTDCDLSTPATRMVYGSVALNSLVGTHLFYPAQSQDWRVKDLSDIKAGTRLQLVFDASTATDYATTWLGTDIVRLRIDPDPTDTSIVIDIHSITVCSENPYDKRGAECYNTRATCQDPESYRDKPDRYLTADVTLTQGEAVPASGTANTNLFFAVDVRFGSEPDGIIWVQGDAATDAVFLGVTSGNLVFRAGDGSVASGANTGKISVDATPYAGTTQTLYGEIDFAASGTCTVRLWSFCPCTKELTFIGEDTWTDTSGAWAATVDGGVGILGSGDVATGESSADWNGRVSALYLYLEQLASIISGETYESTMTLGRGDVGEPTDELYILPCLTDLGTIGTRINIAGSDDNYEPLGRRASVDFSCGDFTHSDIGQDPYVRDRLQDPSELSTFWRKWLVRQKFGKVNASVKVLDGYAGQKISDYRMREYLLDMANYNEDGLAFRARDILSLTEFRKAQVPAASSGALAADVTADALEFVLVGDVRADYPTPCTVRINDELILFHSATYDSGTDRTTFALLDSSGRGTDGSTPEEHDIDDLVQLCRRYTNASVSEVLLGLLMDDAGVPGQQVDVDGIETEDELYLSAYRLTTLITEPTSVSRLIGKLSEECSFYCWWDERAQVVRAQAIRAIDVGEDVGAEWTYEDNIVGGSMRLEEKPKQRLNVIDFYYNPIDFADDLDKAANFKNGLKVVNGTTSLPEQYGDYVQSRTIYSRWLSTEAVANQTSSRLALRFADVPLYAEFLVDAKDRAIWAGDYVTISHPLIVDQYGQRDVRRYLVVEPEEIDPGHLVRYRVADITLDGIIYRITANGIGNYTAALFAAGNAFITDNDGLNSDGTEGAKLA